MNFIRQFYDWSSRQIHKPYATVLLAFLFFIEATVFIIPVDPLLMLYCIEYRSRAWYFATIATTASVVGGVFGYAIGFALWKTIGSFIVSYLISEATFAKVVSWFSKYEMAAVLIGGFSPIPYKAVTISAGFCKLPLMPFIFYSFIARGARFYLVALIAALWGDQMKQYIDRYFNILVLLFTGILVGGFALLKLAA